MKRRGFLGLLGAVIAAPFVPTPAVPAPTWKGVDLASKPDVTAVSYVTRDRTVRPGRFIQVTVFGDQKVWVQGLSEGRG